MILRSLVAGVLVCASGAALFVPGVLVSLLLGHSAAAGAAWEAMAIVVVGIVFVCGVLALELWEEGPP